MAGETDLRRMLRGMNPELHPEPYGIVVGTGAPVAGVFAMIAEAEGTTLVAAADVLRAAGFVLPEVWARISLRLHSDLAAVGLTAAFSTALAQQGISANVIAGYHHDHVLVQWDRRAAAMDALLGLARDA